MYRLSIACILAAKCVAGSRISPRPQLSGIIGKLMQVAEIKPDPINFDDVAALAHDDMEAVNRLISTSLASDVALVSQVSEYIVMSGGKRLRPVIVLLAARALGYQGEQHVRAAAIIEFIHTATLLHDDVVDSSERRRGQDSANTVFGNQASVLVGDFLYSRSFQMMVDIGAMRVMQILADATNTIAAGEVQQLMNVHDPSTTEDDYQQVIYRKTARLFEAGAQIAAVLAKQDPAIETAMIEYGRHLDGQASQRRLRRREASRHGLPAHRRCTRLRCVCGRTGQEPRGRPCRGQADAASYLRDAHRERQPE